MLPEIKLICFCARKRTVFINIQDFFFFFLFISPTAKHFLGKLNQCKRQSERERTVDKSGW